MAAPSHVYTIARVAKMLDQDEATLEEIAMQMDPEDGCLSVIDLDDEVFTTAFTPFGVENLQEILTNSKPGEIPKEQTTSRARRTSRYSVDDRSVPRLDALLPWN